MFDIVYFLHIFILFYSCSILNFNFNLSIFLLPPRHRNCRSLTFDIKRGIYSPPLVPEARNRT